MIAETTAFDDILPFVSGHKTHSGLDLKGSVPPGAVASAVATQPTY